MSASILNSKSSSVFNHQYQSISTNDIIDNINDDNNAVITINTDDNNSIDHINSSQSTYSVKTVLIRFFYIIAGVLMFVLSIDLITYYRFNRTGDVIYIIRCYQHNMYDNHAFVNL